MQRSHPLCRDAAAASLLLAVALAIFRPFLFTDEVLLPGQYLARFRPFTQQPVPSRCLTANWDALKWDALAQYYPWRLYAHRALREGEIPLWNPHQFCGAPFLPNLQAAVLYPPNLLFWVFDPARAFGWAAFLHVLFAGLGVYLYARRLLFSRAAGLVAGMAFLCCGFIQGWTQLPTLMNVAAWIPWALLATEGLLGQRPAASAIALAVVVALQFLAGHLQVSFYLLLIVACRLLWLIGVHAVHGTRPQSFRLAAQGWAIGAFVIGGMLAAGQLLPTMELAEFSHRAGAPSAAGYQWNIEHALPASHLITLFSPDFYGNPSQGTFWGARNYTEYAGTVGVVVLMLAFLGLCRNRKEGTLFWSLAAVATLAAAVGSGINRLFYFCVPGFSHSGGFARVLVLFCLSAAMVAAVGTEAMLEATPAVRKRWLALLALAFLAAFLAALLAAWFPLKGRIAFDELLVLQPWAVLRPLLLAGGLLAVLGLSRLPRRVSVFCLLTLVAVDVVPFAVRCHITGPRPLVYPHTELLERLARQSARDYSRILPISNNWPLQDFPDATLPPNGAMVYGLYDVQGYDSLMTTHYKAVAAELEGGSPCPLANGNMLLLHNAGSSRATSLGVKHVLAGSPILGRGKWQKVGDTYLGLYPVFPRCSLAAYASVGPIECPIATYGQNRVAVILPMNPEGFDMHLTDSWYPGWRAWVDGKERGVEPFLDFGRSVAVTPRDQRVEMVYLPTSFRVGVFTALVAAALMAAWGVSLRPRQKRLLSAPQTP